MLQSLQAVCCTFFLQQIVWAICCVVAHKLGASTLSCSFQLHNTRQLFYCGALSAVSSSRLAHFYSPLLLAFWARWHQSSGVLAPLTCIHLQKEASLQWHANAVCHDPRSARAKEWWRKVSLRARDFTLLPVTTCRALIGSRNWEDMMTDRLFGSIMSLRVFWRAARSAGMDRLPVLGSGDDDDCFYD